MDDWLLQVFYVQEYLESAMPAEPTAQQLLNFFQRVDMTKLQQQVSAWLVDGQSLKFAVLAVYSIFVLLKGFFHFKQHSLEIS